MLPEIRNVTPQRLNFPAPWQAVLFRNYRMVPAENIAAVLGCDTNTIHREATRLGLSQKEYDPDWLSRGYITIIRNNWYLLPYEQLLTLLDFSKERLDFVLEKDDFLWVKLGHYKPDCPVVRYAPLTEEQEAKTWVTVLLICSAQLITGFGWFDSLAKFAGAGCIVPITGFANAMVAPAIEYKAEGPILGVGAKLFSVAGPVLVCGITASVIVGVIHWMLL